MGYPLYYENDLPVTLLTSKVVLLGGRALIPMDRGEGGCTESHPLGVKFSLLLSNYLDYQLLGMGREDDWIPAGSSF